jgi:hypothetical protein
MLRQGLNTEYEHAGEKRVSFSGLNKLVCQLTKIRKIGLRSFNTDVTDLHSVIKLLTIVKSGMQTVKLTIQ